MPTHIAVSLILGGVALVISFGVFCYCQGRFSMEREFTREILPKQLSGVSWEEFDAVIRIRYEWGKFMSVKLKERTTQKVA